MRKFKFFHGQSLNLPDQGRFNNLVNHRPQLRYTYVYDSAIPREQMSDELFEIILNNGKMRLREDALLPRNVPVEWRMEQVDGIGFRLRFEIFLY